MRRFIVLAGGGLALAAMILAQPRALRADERVTFDSAHYVVGNLQQRLARERGEAPLRAHGPAIQGYLSKPDGAGPFPAVVHLHGCEGLTERARKANAERTTQWGYVALAVDSFTTRAMKDDCVSQPADRQADAFGALLYLSTLPFVDPKRIALVGHGQGGMAALQAASYRPYKLFEVPDGLSFRAVVAYYPQCNAAATNLALPALILIGEFDDWSPIKLCEWWLQRRAGRGAPVKLVIYREAFHGFDNPAVRNGMDFTFGHWMKYDAEAAARAAGEMRDFLFNELSR
ncbi:MAG: dienelactone hydrolase family protein [Pseudolabrys sp.]|jgi:dienelactone hydrolase